MFRRIKRPLAALAALALLGAFALAEDERAAQPVMEEPSAGESVMEESVSDEPVMDESAVDESVIEESVMEETVAEESVMEETAADEPVMEESVMEEPSAEDSVMEEPVAEESVMEETVTDEPVAGEPVMEEPAAEESVMEEPAADEPVMDEPVMEEPVIMEPVPETTPETTPEPIPEPAPVIDLRVTAPEGTAILDGVCAVDMTRATALSLAWDCGAPCDGYALSLVDPDGAELLGGWQPEAALTLSLEGRAPGRYALTVTAMLGDAPVASAGLSIDLARGQSPEGQRSQGGGHSGGRSGGASGGASDDRQAQGFRVTPGTALTGSHASGTMDMRLYGSVELTAQDAPMTRLTLGGEALEIGLADDTAFVASVEGDTLALTAGADNTWRLNGYALRRLGLSGIHTIRLEAGEWSREMSTEQVLSGEAYARLRAGGVASSDCEYRVSAEGVILVAGGTAYAIDEENTLIPMEGD